MHIEDQSGNGLKTTRTKLERSHKSNLVTESQKPSEHASFPSAMLKLMRKLFDDPARFVMERNWLLLVIGIVLKVLQQYRWGVGFFGWFHITPILVFIFTNSPMTWYRWILVFASLQIGSIVGTLKIVTEPVPTAFAFVFGIPEALGLFIVLAMFSLLQKRLGIICKMSLYAGLMFLFEWLNFRFSPLGMWSTSATSQAMSNLPILQLASLGGVGLIGVVISAVQSGLAIYLNSKRDEKQGRRALFIAFVLVSVALTFGSIRIFAASPGPTVRAAAVLTDLHLDPSGDMPPLEELHAGTDEMFERTDLAASWGAEIVVWNEASIALDLAAGDSEEDFLIRGEEAAKRLAVDVVVAYAVLFDTEEFSYDNKFVWISNEGKRLETYRKHHPVPGEPCIRGIKPLEVHQRPWGRATGAICYDYDFPAISLEQARGNPGLAVVPSSDWKGIDPYHTRMASLRGIEGGFSVVRSARLAASSAFDAYGRLRASLSYFEDNHRVMIADVPSLPIVTLYSRVGDWPLVGFAVLTCVYSVWVSLLARDDKRND